MAVSHKPNVRLCEHRRLAERNARLKGRPAPPTALSEVALAARLLRGLPSFLHHPLTVEVARTILRKRLEQRESDFLAVGRSVFATAHSPYRRLLALAGCEYADLERLVRRDGVEGALAALYRAGVYLSVEEFKGRTAVVRGATTIESRPELLLNPLARSHVGAQSSGSGGAATAVAIDLRFIRDCAVDTLLALEARGAAAAVKAVWEAPGAGATFRLLKYSAFGAPVARWFSPLELSAPSLHSRYRWSARLIRWESRVARRPLPLALHVPLSAPLPLVRWLASVTRTGATAHLFTLASPAVRACHAALDAGVDLRGVQIVLAGEPVTEARRAVVAASGAEPVARYGSIETGPIGYACAAPAAPDDVHLLHDLHAVIQPGAPAAERGFPATAVFVSSLRPTSPYVMLNVSMGDSATVDGRVCGCPLERLGWSTHLHAIRSYEKLTVGGTTFLDTDVVRVLEEVLPGRFGGAPTDYQLLEEEAEDGRPRVRLLVDPEVGPLDDGAVAEAFLDAIGRGSGGEQIMSQLWRDAETLQVERRAPLTTHSGKIHHLVRSRHG